MFVAACCYWYHGHGVTSINERKVGMMSQIMFVEDHAAFDCKLTLHTCSRQIP